jgi:hypothetical protein
MKSGMVVLVVGAIVALVVSAVWVYFIHAYTTLPLPRQIMADLIGVVAVGSATFWILGVILRKVEREETAGKAAP